jgi:hypothetical protein
LNCAAPPQLRRLHSCPKMRSDLRFVHENDGSDDVQRLPGLLRINDLPNDRKFDFTAKGHFLCRGADGVAAPDELQQRLQGLPDTPLTAPEVVKVFRRLNILGLPESGDVAPAPAPAISSSTRSFAAKRCAPQRDQQLRVPRQSPARSRPARSQRWCVRNQKPCPQR